VLLIDYFRFFTFSIKEIFKSHSDIFYSRVLKIAILWGTRQH